MMIPNDDCLFEGGPKPPLIGVFSEQLVPGLYMNRLIFFNVPSGYLLHSHGKWPIEIDCLPIKNGDVPWLC